MLQQGVQVGVIGQGAVNGGLLASLCQCGQQVLFFLGEMGLQAVLIMLGQFYGDLLPYQRVILPGSLAGLHGQRQGMVMVVREWGKGCAAFHDGGC